MAQGLSFDNKQQDSRVERGFRAKPSGVRSINHELCGRSPRLNTSTLPRRHIDAQFPKLGTAASGVAGLLIDHDSAPEKTLSGRRVLRCSREDQTPRIE